MYTLYSRPKIAEYSRPNSGMYPWLMPMFRDPHKWLKELEKALAGEAEAIEFYAYLESIAPTAEAREQIHHAHQDEMEHYQKFSRLYERLTGRPPAVEKIVVARPDFVSGVFRAFNDELEAAHLYRGMLLGTWDMTVRDLMFEIMTDEMEHADRFTMIMAMDMAEAD